ncbi:hypothetical protein PI125_g22590 [Phytophthora idaei]|nr:hypothetical protein PI125_g22590 [Phytophthora idaei]
MKAVKNNESSNSKKVNKPDEDGKRDDINTFKYEGSAHPVPESRRAQACVRFAP